MKRIFKLAIAFVVCVSIQAAPVPGTIQAEDYDVGGEGVAYHDTNKGNTCIRDRPGVYRQDDVDIESKHPGEFSIGFARFGEWLHYTVTVPTAGVYDLDLRIACNYSPRHLRFEIDGKTLLAKVPIPHTGDSSTFKVITIPNVALPSGKHTLKLLFATGNINIDLFQSEIIQV